MAMSDAKKPRSKAHAGDYKVGRGRPPVHSRFKPGQCGNPKGRGKGVRNFATDVKAALKAPVKITRDGKRRTISTQQALILRLREMALAGNGRAIDRLMQLAQIYNNADFAAVDGLSVADAAVLDVYKARLLSGAAASDAADGGQKPDDSSAASPPTTWPTSSCSRISGRLGAR
jgi:hypothetical protein